ncbi:hypothetical protein [Immundisolibacter sp.]
MKNHPPTSADETTECITTNICSKKEKAAAPPSKKQIKGVTRNDDPDRKTIPNQGGQGNIGQRVRRGSSLAI